MKIFENFSKSLLHFIIFLAVIGMIFLLMTVNTKLLIHLNWIKTQNPLWDNIILPISGLSFALGSISVILWYNPKKPAKQAKNDTKREFYWKYIGNIILKAIFVTLDALHIFIYNNTHIEDLAAWVSPIFALQAGLILFFIGAIVEDIIRENN